MKKTTIWSLARILLATILTLTACSNDDNSNSGVANIKDYRIVKIGEQTWMAENLNYAIEGSVCQDNNIDSCSKYGRLYDWATAMALPTECNENECVEQVKIPHRGICPKGWHIPSHNEWTTLTTFVENDNGCTSCAGKHLKAKYGWEIDKQGDDTYGFTALPNDMVFPGEFGFLWSTSDYEWYLDGNDAYVRISGAYAFNVDSDYTYLFDTYKRIFLSVRCLQD